MKVTVGDVVNNKVNIRDYMGYDEETGRIYVCGEALDIVLVDKSEEWKKLKEENKRYREALEEISKMRIAYADMAGAKRTAEQALEAIKDEQGE